MSDEPSRAQGEGAAGTAVWGCLVTGFGGLALTLWMLITGQGAVAGVPLTASALAFGLLANAALRR